MQIIKKLLSPKAIVWGLKALRSRKVGAYDQLFLLLGKSFVLSVNGGDTTTYYNKKKQLVHHQEAVTDPESGPAAWTVRDVGRLTVEGDGVGRHVTDRTAADKVRDFPTFDGHHR